MIVQTTSKYTRLAEQLLHDLAVALGQAGVVDADAELQAVLQTRVRAAALRLSVCPRPPQYIHSIV